MLDSKEPGAVRSGNQAQKETTGSDDVAPPKPKRKPGASLSKCGRYLIRNGPTGTTTFDTWRWRR